MNVNSVVLYKNNVAFVSAVLSGGKYTVQFASGAKQQVAEQNVREKDVTLLAQKATSLQKVLDCAKDAPLPDDLCNTQNPNPLAQSVSEVWALLSSDSETASSDIQFEELWSLIRPNIIGDEAYLVYLALCNTVFFTQKEELVFVPRTQQEIDGIVQKAEQKDHDAQVRDEFIKRLRQHKLIADDFRLMGDVESLALGKSEKSRTLHDAQIKETPERAHRILLDTGVWDITRNPYPSRMGVPLQSAQEKLLPPPSEERFELSQTCYAIDDEWAQDPDDAISYDGKYLWVHIADPASSIMPDSEIDRAARIRGSTLYIPEKISRMLCEDSLKDYALGLSEKSNALSFKILLDENGNLLECSVVKTSIKVKRLTYTQAEDMAQSPELKIFYDIAQRNIARRKKAGAVFIDLPEVHIKVNPETKAVSVIPEEHLKSHEVVREMMLLAGEGAAKFAFSNNIPFPYVSQDSPEIPSDIPEGLAGQMRLRKCMRKRSVGVTPAMHSGLGLAMYSQVTSPLRRYSDLIAHEQLRAFLDGRPLLDKDVMLERVSAGDMALSAVNRAAYQSDTHWTLVYLLQNPDWTGEAVCVDKSGRQPQFIIPSLALETFLSPNKDVSLSESITVKVLEINLSELTSTFVQV